jgi:hypothetical protein
LRLLEQCDIEKCPNYTETWTTAIALPVVRLALDKIVLTAGLVSRLVSMQVVLPAASGSNVPVVTNLRQPQDDRAVPPVDPAIDRRQPVPVKICRLRWH